MTGSDTMLVLARTFRGESGLTAARSGLVFAVIVGLVAAVAIALIARSRAHSRLPRGVLKRISVPGARHHVRVDNSNSMAGTWNPAKPFTIDNFIHEHGEGTYWLDDDGLVHLDWTPLNGRTVHLAGPAPALRIRSKAARVGTAGYAVLLLAAFATGYLMSSGDSTSRLGVAMFAAFVAAVVGWLVSIGGLVGRSVQVFAKRRGSGSTADRDLPR